MKNTAAVMEEELERCICGGLDPCVCGHYVPETKFTDHLPTTTATTTSPSRASTSRAACVPCAPPSVPDGASEASSEHTLTSAPALRPPDLPPDEPEPSPAAAAPMRFLGSRMFMPMALGKNDKPLVIDQSAQLFEALNGPTVSARVPNMQN